MGVEVVRKFNLSTMPVARPLSQWPGIAVELVGTQTRFVQGERWRHRVIECGEAGQPLILIHGVGGHAEAWARNLHNLAANGFHVYAIDALFHGLSGKEPWDDDDWNDIQVEGVIDLVDALGHDRVHVEGESMGALITFELGMRFPERVNRLVINTGFGRYKAKRTDFVTPEGGGSVLKELSQKSLLEPTFENLRARMEWLVARPEYMTDEMVAIRQRLYAIPEVHESMKRVYRIGKPWNFRLKWEEADLAGFKPEALVLWSEFNPTRGPDYGEYSAGLLPNAQFYCMRGVRHWPQWEKPEEHDAVVTRFLHGG